MGVFKTRKNDLSRHSLRFRGAKTALFGKPAQTPVFAPTKVCQMGLKGAVFVQTGPRTGVFPPQNRRSWPGPQRPGQTRFLAQNTISTSNSRPESHFRDQFWDQFDPRLWSLSTRSGGVWPPVCHPAGSFWTPSQPLCGPMKKGVFQKWSFMFLLVPTSPKTRFCVFCKEKSRFLAES